jgi:regulator of protease activity HflC (stomatin/prohibitin superfamily)
MEQRPEYNENRPMADTPDDGVPIDEEPMELEQPRRAASAEFVVESQAGSQAMLREAMDPANQSLRDALRLSFRVLQVVIIVLVILFVFSGFQTVEEGQSGVMLRWGRILEIDGREALEPGLKFSKWPYPAGEFVLFEEKGRSVDLGSTFWPSIPPGVAFEQAVERASVNDMLRPGRDGSLISSDGDLAHIKLEGEYEIEDPVAFVNTVENRVAEPGALDADRLVELALQRAVVHTAAGMELQEIVELTEEDKALVQRRAQQLLDRTDSGMRLSWIDTPIDPTPPLPIRRAYSELQAQKVQVAERIEKARENAAQELIAVAGPAYREIIALIEQYEQALDLDDRDQAQQLQRAIDQRLESDETSGDVSRIISSARSYRSQIESSLGSEARRFRTLLPAYREHPELVVARQWTEAVTRVLTRDDVEIMYVPAGMGLVRLHLAGLDEVRQIRRDQMLEGKESEAMRDAFGEFQPMERASDLDRQFRGQPGRRLDRDQGRP